MDRYVLKQREILNILFFFLANNYRFVIVILYKKKEINEKVYDMPILNYYCQY